MSMLLICNPGSRAGRGQRLWTLWMKGLQGAGVHFDCAVVGPNDDACALARTTHARTVVAVGGDGTISGVLDGIVQSGDPHKRMGVLYAGTSPDFCRFHGIPIDPAAALRALLAETTRRVDVARITLQQGEDREQSAHFGCSCNIGMGANIARDANRWRRFAGDIPGTAAAALRAMLTHRPVDLEMCIDGEDLLLPRVNNLTISKNPFLASGLRLRLDVQPDDGTLWLVGIHGQSHAGMCRVLPRCYSGTVTGIPGVLVRRCRSVTIRSSQPREIEFDGDPRGALPIHIEVLPRALSLLGVADG